MKRMIPLLALLTIGTSSCDKIIGYEGETESKDVEISIPIDKESRFAQVASKAMLTVFDSSDEIVLKQELTISETAVSGTVEDILVGDDYTFTIEVLNADAELVYSGSAVSSIVENEITEIDIAIEAVETTGDAIINGTIVDEKVITTLKIGSRESVKDAYIVGAVIGSSSRFQSLHYGNRGWMRVGEYDNASRFRGLVQFSTEGLGGKKVISAKLVLNNAFWVRKHNDIATTVEVYPMIAGWNEGNGIQSNSESTHTGEANTPEVNGATGNEAVAGVPWSEAMVGTNGIDAAKEPVATLTKSVDDGSALEWEFDITELVQQWVKSPELNKGVLLKMADENRGTLDKKSIPSFITWDNIDPKYDGQGPTLVVEFEK